MSTERLDDQMIEKVEYHVVHCQDGIVSAGGKVLYEKLRAYWEKSWTETFKLLKSSETLNPEDFLMQSRIAALMYEDEVVGMHLLKDYSKDDFRTHKYFKNYYDDKFLNYLESKSINGLQSFQYFWVDPKWSKKKTGVNFAAIVASLSLKYQESLNLDASITVARKDNAAYELACGFGFEEIVSSVMHNVPVAQMVCLKPQTFPDMLVAKYTSYFWKNKIEYKYQNNIKKSA